MVDVIQHRSLSPHFELDYPCVDWNDLSRACSRISSLPHVYHPSVPRNRAVYTMELQDRPWT
ncbi:hypothetical protein BDV09DRAFT_173197 [Aspergillus tetrazonus]